MTWVLVIVNFTADYTLLGLLLLTRRPNQWLVVTGLPIGLLNTNTITLILLGCRTCYL